MNYILLILNKCHFFIVLILFIIQVDNILLIIMPFYTILLDFFLI